MKVGGVIYLHDISQTRMLGTTRKNFDMFRKLCGDDSKGSVILGTTKWSDIEPGLGARHETQLINTYWQDIIAGGSRVFRFTDSQASAKNIVNGVLDNFEERLALRIQSELVDLHRYLPETDAGRALRYTLEQLLQIQKKAGADLQSRADDEPEVMAQLLDNENQIRKTLGQIKELHVSIPRRVMTFFGLTVR
jgi:hypothetical protein